MKSSEPGAALRRALELSRELLRVAECGDPRSTAILDAERREILSRIRTSGRPLADSERQCLLDIMQLNDWAIGQLEHRRRVKERQMDTVATGRRALAAYSSTQLRG
jgi:hypothetical protein